MPISWFSICLGKARTEYSICDQLRCFVRNQCRRSQEGMAICISWARYHGGRLQLFSPPDRAIDIDGSGGLKLIVVEREPDLLSPMIATRTSRSRIKLWSISSLSTAGGYQGSLVPWAVYYCQWSWEENIHHQSCRRLVGSPILE